MTLPVVVVLAMLIGGLAAPNTPPAGGPAPPTSAVLPPITVAAPPVSASTQPPCTALLQALPVRLDGLAPRVVHPQPDSPFVVAWGDPAVVLRCGVARPKDLVPGSSVQYFAIAGRAGRPVYFDRTQTSSANVFTSVDRAAYVEVSVPSRLAAGPLPALADAIAASMPAVCVVDPAETDLSKLCTRRR